MKHITAIEAHDCMISALSVHDNYIVTGGKQAIMNMYM